MAIITVIGFFAAPAGILQADAQLSTAKPGQGGRGRPLAPMVQSDPY